MIQNFKFFRCWVNAQTKEEPGLRTRSIFFEFKLGFEVSFFTSLSESSAVSFLRVQVRVRAQ